MPLSTPRNTRRRREYDTITRTRFFDAFDRKKKGTSIGSIARRPNINIPPSTARLWIKQRETSGSLALRRLRRSSSKLGRPTKVPAGTLDILTDQANPIYGKSYVEQIEELELPCAPRTLQHYAAQAGARRFRKAITSEISAKNKTERVKYAEQHKDKTITDFWQYIWFTDEVRKAIRVLRSVLHTIFRRLDLLDL